MTLVPLDPIPQRNTQGTKITSLQHDEIHEDLRTAINALIAEVNTLSGGGGSSAPTGSVFAYAGTTEPTGYFFVNGAAKSRALYAALFAVCGTTYGAGDGVTTFNIPNVIGRVISGTNPMGGVTEGGLTLRALGATFGAETVSYTPAGSVSQASIASLTATSSAINTSALVVPSASIQALLNAISATSSAIDISGVTATSAAISIGSLTATCGAISIGSLTTTVTLANGAVTGMGSVSVTGAACFNVTEAVEIDISVMDCASPLVADISTIAAGLTTNVTVASAVIGGSIPSPTITIGGSIPTPTITIGGTIPTPTITVSVPVAGNISIGGSIPTPTITLGGSIPVQTFTGTPANVSTLQPSIAMNYIIKY